MDLVELAFHLFKDEESKGRKHLRNIIKDKFNNITDEQLNEVTLRIYNYQVDKYGYTLTVFPDKKTVDELRKIHKKASVREYDRRKRHGN